VFKAPPQCIDIAGAKGLKPMIELVVNPFEETENSPRGASAIVDLFFAASLLIQSVGKTRVDFIDMLAQKKSHHRRHDRAREKIRSEHGEDHSHGERLKKKSGSTAQEKNRHENDANTESGDKRRHRNL